VEFARVCKTLLSLGLFETRNGKTAFVTNIDYFQTALKACVTVEALKQIVLIKFSQINFIATDIRFSYLINFEVLYDSTVS